MLLLGAVSAIILIILITHLVDRTIIKSGKPSVVINYRKPDVDTVPKSQAVPSLSSDPQIFETRACEYSDTVLFDNQNSGIINYSAEFPAGKSPADCSIRFWIARMLSGGDYRGKAEDCRALFEYCARTSQIQSYKSSANFGNYYNRIDFRHVHITPNFISYAMNRNYCFGERRNSRVFIGATFRKSDGREIGFDAFDSGKLDILQQFVNEEIKNQIRSKHNALTSKISWMFNSRKYDLSNTRPVFMPAGVQFAFSVKGDLVFAVIPYAKCGACFSPLGRSLLADRNEE